MKKHCLFVGLPCLIVLSCILLMDTEPLRAADVLRYKCSAQVYDAFADERLNAFTKKTGIRVELDVSSSRVAVEQLSNGHGDMASSAMRLPMHLKEKGFVETAFCKDPLAVITHPQTPVENITDQQLRDIFSGSVTNWKEVGGPDKPIIVILPGQETAAYRNFSQRVMNGKEMKFDLMTSTSTMVVEAVRRFQGSISFVTQGATRSNMPGTQLVKVNGAGPTDEGYPFYQVFSFITKGEPSGAAKQFIDFALSQEGAQIAAERGVILHTVLEE